MSAAHQASPHAEKNMTGISMEQVELLFGSIDTLSLGYISRYQFEETLRSAGIAPNDARVSEVRRRLDDTIGERIDLARFAEIIEPNAALIERIIRRQLVIPDWRAFTRLLTEIFHETKANNEGRVAAYIPELALADPNWFGVSFCSVDGQVFSIGDTNREFSVQSSSKPLSYLMALEELGEETVHRYVGREPSGRNYNDLSLSPELIPHNPMVNAGAIMVCSLIHSKLEQSARFRHIMSTWSAASGDQRYVTFSNSTYLSERATADRNFCLGYMMQEAGSFQLGSTRQRHMPGREWGANDLVRNLELYFQNCSIQTTSEGQSIIGSTLASGGRCPVTDRQCFSGGHVRGCLSLMLSCGMYDYSGEWAYKIGLPAKSGVSGCLMVVIPNVGGLSIYSPPLDSLGNTVRGVEFCKKLVDRCSFHFYDIVYGNLASSSAKMNPSSAKKLANQNELTTLCTLCAKGDLTGIRAVLSAGADPNGADYDGRTPLHLAASEGQLAVVHYLCAIPKLNLNPVDRWGGTPFSDAIREGHPSVAEYLSQKLQAQGIMPSASNTAATTTNNNTNTTPATTAATTPTDLATSKHADATIIANESGKLA